MSEISESLADAGAKRSSRAKNIKIAVLALASIGLMAAIWTLVNAGLYAHQPLWSWVWVVAAMMLWVISTSFFVMVNTHSWLTGFINLANLVLYVILLPHNFYVLAGGVLFYLLSFLMAKRILSEEKNQMHFSIRRTISSGLVVAIYAFLVVIGFNLYHSTNEDFKANPQKFYDRLGESVAKSIPFLTENAGGVNLNQSLDDYLTNQADSTELQQAPPAERNVIIGAAREQFLKQFGIDAKGNEPLADVISRIIDDKSKDVLGRFEKFFPLIFTLVIIGLLRTFAFIFDWLTLFFAWLLFRILLALRFFRIGKAQVEVDQLEV
jgi:hypothetical protein